LFSQSARNPFQRFAFYTWFQYSKNKPSITTKLVALGAMIIAGGVVLSTLFVKQHYIADEIPGVALALVVGKLIFKRLWNSKQEDDTQNQQMNNA
jgi:membrane-associated phospholipid phosphatase